MPTLKALKPLSEFLYNRRGQKYEYRFTYCLDCRKKQLNDNLNNNLDSFLCDVYNRTRLRAIKSGIPFTITREQFLAQFHAQFGKCFYTDEVLVCRVGEGKSRNACSVDKIIPGVGYILGNVVFCTNRANTAKSDFNLSEIAKWMPDWHARIISFTILLD